MNDLERFKKIGIMGGTFDPIHNGHLEMAKSALMQENLDKILFIPTGQSHMKESPTDRSMRLRLTELAIKGHEDFLVSDMEIKREGNTYTYETLTILKEKYPHIDFYFILGADSLFSIEKWYKSKLIFDKCTILVAFRGEYSLEDLNIQIAKLEEQYEAKISILNMPLFPVSSTMIRKLCKDNISINDYVPKDVCEYIQNNNIYH